jgi:septum formation protein
MTRSNQPPRLILASASPRRAELLRQHGHTFDIVPPDDEPAHLFDHLPPTEHAEALSLHKAQNVAARLDAGLILAADTIAALAGRIIGKPIDRDHARKIITALAGTTHQVITGVTLLDAAAGRAHTAAGRAHTAAGRAHTAHDITAVTMRPLSSNDIERYLDTDDWQGKAGAYGIQDHGDRFVTGIKGSFTNVVGLPMELLATMLASLDHPPPT